MKLTKLLILLLFLSLKWFSQQAPIYTLKYDKTEFCAGSNEFANPTITNSKSEVLKGTILSKVKYSYTQISNSGHLTIDGFGKVDISKSDIGAYLINSVIELPTQNVSLESFKIIIKACK